MAILNRVVVTRYRVGDGVVWVYGLANCGYSDVIEIEVEGSAPAEAFALNLNEEAKLVLCY